MLSSDINCYTVMSWAVYMPRAVYKNRNRDIIVLPPQLLYLNSFHVKQECYCLFGFFSFKTTIEKTSHNYCKQNSWLWVYQIFFSFFFYCLSQFFLVQTKFWTIINTDFTLSLASVQISRASRCCVLMQREHPWSCVILKIPLVSKPI